MARAPFVAAALVLLTVTAAGCGGSSKQSSSAESEGGKTTVAGVPANNHGTKQVSGKTELELDDYYFEPTVLKGKPGARVSLELKNEGSVEHNFSINSQGIDKDIEAGQSATVTVMIPRSGVLSFYCKYHKSQGMAGALMGNGTSSGGGGMPTGSTTTTRKGY
jgi:plastocyanin